MRAVAGNDYVTMILVWLACLVLLAATIGSYYVNLGPWNVAINLGVAFAKASLIFWFFMHVREGSALVRLFAGGGFFWLAVMFGLGLSDYLTRAPW